MKKIILPTLLSLLALSALAQDEGTAVAQARFARSKSIHFSGGPSKTFGKNIGDYSNGLSFEGGYLKRLNKVLSIGSAFSYSKFKYDPSITTDVGGAYIGFISDVQDPDYYEGYVINLKGGDVTLLSISFDLKIDFIPVNDNSKIAIYGFVKPFISSASRAEVSGLSDYYRTDDPDGLTNWRVEESGIAWGADDYPALKKKSNITGGIFIGPGIEFLPSKPVSFYTQVAFGYTFPVSMVSTESYGSDLEDYFNEDFPLIKKGFPSLNIQFGFSFNF